MIANPSKPLRATLHVGRNEACVFWSFRTESGVIHFSIDGPETLPSVVWREAVEFLGNELAQRPNGKSFLASCRWRLVLPGGFYVMAARPIGRWSTTLAHAAANDLETVCPVALDDLQTAAVPLSANAAWVCGFPETTLEQWQQAARESDIALEGVWTQAGALVDWALEEGIPLEHDPATWQDGLVRVELGCATINTQAPEHVGNRVRVYSCREIPAATGFPISPSDSVIHFPGSAAHQLQEIDPSESLNLLRNVHSSSVLQRRIQRPLAGVAGIWASAMIILAVANLASTQDVQKRSRTAQEQIASLWHQTQGASPLPPLAVTTLEQQAASWRAARSTLPVLGPMRPSIVAAWAALVEHLPADLTVAVSSLRTRGRELWIDGQVKSQADARRLEAAWNALSSLNADPMRLSAGGGGDVSFSVRMVMR